MPLPEELRASMDSPVADIANVGDRMGGMLVAGLFLREFVPTTDGSPDGPRIPWAHLDIAGPAFNDGGPHGYTGKGGTGVAVRTLVALAEELSA
jgi:leucyl aminopeptidase